VTAAGAGLAVPDTTDETFELLRELRRGRARQRAANLAYWLYLAGLAILIYGGWLVAAIVRALRHPPPPIAETPALQLAAPASLCVLSFAILAVLLWDARWRGPVTIGQATADWLLDTPVDRARLLRPRYRRSAAANLIAGAAAGLVPVALLLAAGLGSGGLGHSVRLAGVTVLGTALLAGLGTGIAAWSQARPRAGGRVLAPVTAAALAFAILGAISAAVTVPAIVATAALWSGPWGWAAQGPVALAGGSARFWPVAMAALALAAVAALIAGDRIAADVPAAALRARAHTVGNMSAAVVNLDTRRVTTAYRGATGAYARARLRIRPPRQRWLVLPWRDLVALVRAPSRLIWCALLSFAAVGLGALAVRAPRESLLALVAALSLGYLAAAGLCEGARLDGDDPLRSAQLPFRFPMLVWWHAPAGCVAFAVLAGIPAAVLAGLTGHLRLLVLVAVAIPVLVAGALVNSFRGELEGEMFGGFDTPLGNSSGITIALWYATGPLLAIGPLIVLCYRAVTSAQSARLVQAVVLSAVLATWLALIATRRARRLRSW
jgi:hypothetical protein